jgi:hypothetical protein
MEMSFLLSLFVAGLVGGLVCTACTLGVMAWRAHSARKRQESLAHELRTRECLYGEFVHVCSKLLLDYMEEEIVAPDTLASVVAAINRIRIMASGPVLKAAESALQHFTETYLEDELLSLDEKTTHLRHLTFKNQDPLAGFSNVCRKELAELHV